MKRSIESALSRIRPHILRTPIFRASEMLLSRSPLATLLRNRRDLPDGTQRYDPIELYIKCENMQKSGSFKFRGALNALTQLSDGQLRKGIVSYSTGNHAKALALASQLLSMERGYRVPITIIMSNHATQSKVRAVADAGAMVIQHGDIMPEARLEAQYAAKQQELVLISPADNQDVMLGQGTVMLEFIDQMAEMGAGKLDAVVLPSGGGSLLAGSAIAAHGMGIDVFGSEPLANRAAKGGGSTTFDSSTVADCLRCPVSALNWDIIKDKEYVRDIYLTPEDDIRTAMALFIDATKTLIEPGSAVPLAVVLFHEAFRETCRQGGRPLKIGVVLTGGNIALDNAHVLTR